MSRELMKLERDGDVFVITFVGGENRWNTTFVRELSRVLDEVEDSSGPAALVTTSSDEKFYSNGLDIDWVTDPASHPEGGDSKVFGGEFMGLMGRIITFPMPTISAINGHAFGAGLMAALCHDLRIMRADRGFLCAPEMQLGMSIPTPELALFRHKMSMSAFHETVQLAKRWSGPMAMEAGFIQDITDIESLLDKAKVKGAELAPLATNRDNFQDQKERLYGENAAINEAHGPAYMLKNADKHGH